MIGLIFTWDLAYIWIIFYCTIFWTPRLNDDGVECSSESTSMQVSSINTESLWFAATSFVGTGVISVPNLDNLRFLDTLTTSKFWIFFKASIHFLRWNGDRSLLLEAYELFCCWGELKKIEFLCIEYSSMSSFSVHNSSSLSEKKSQFFTGLRSLFIIMATSYLDSKISTFFV